MNRLKYGLTLFVGIYLIYNLATQGVNSINSTVFIIYILSIGGELAVYLKKKKESEEAAKEESLAAGEGDCIRESSKESIREEDTQKE